MRLKEASCGKRKGWVDCALLYYHDGEWSECWSRYTEVPARAQPLLLGSSRCLEYLKSIRTHTL